MEVELVIIKFKFEVSVDMWCVVNEDWNDNSKSLDLSSLEMLVYYMEVEGVCVK